MHADLLAAADSLSDHDLLVRVETLAGNERAATAELVAHLAVLDTRPSLYAAGGYGSLFAYCTEGLRLSEDAAYSRVEAARACRRFPKVLELLVSGALTLTAVRLIGRHLTADNHETIIARASNTTVAEVKKLVAELAPQPDVPSSVRKLPVPAAAANTIEVAVALTMDAAPSAPARVLAAAPTLPAPGATPASPPAPAPLRRPEVAPLSPERYRVQFTIDAETKDQLDRLQALLRREIPDGDPALIFKRAIGVLLDKVERQKLGKADRPRPSKVPRFETGEDAAEGTLPPRAPTRAVKRTVWPRDAGRCAYVSPDGRRCSERVFLEFHHQRPYVLRGKSTEDNIALRCRRHNQYEAELVFGGASERGATKALRSAP